MNRATNLAAVPCQKAAVLLAPLVAAPVALAAVPKKYSAVAPRKYSAAAPKKHSAAVPRAPAVALRDQAAILKGQAVALVINRRLVNKKSSRVFQPLNLSKLI
jgi:hypothetical protein